MRNYNGFFKVERKLFSPEWMGMMDAKCRIVFLHLLAWANWGDQRIVRQGKLDCLKRGQLVTSDEELATACLYSRCTIRRKLELLKTLGTIDIKRDNQGTVITICNYSKYQDNKKSDHTTDETTDETTDHTTDETTDHTTDETRNKNLRIKELKESKNTSTEPADAVSVAKKRGRKQKPKEPTEGSQVFKAYAEAMKKRYGSDNVIRDAKANSACKKLVDSVGLDKALKVVEAYVASNDKFLVDNAHSLEFVTRRVQKILIDIDPQKLGRQHVSVSDSGAFE